MTATTAATLAIPVTPVDPVAETHTPLSALLRAGTREVHRDAETMGFIEALMSGAYGERGRAAYTALAVQQYPIYQALEQASAEIGATAEGQSAGLIFDELLRTPAIEQDLEFLLGADWRSQLTVLPATEAYLDALRTSSTSLALYAAHAYTRYLGDLSGGQAIRTMLQRHYGFAADGVSFYSFDDIPKPKVFKDTYRAALDALRFDDAGMAIVVAEAQAAFRYNQELFAALGEAFPVEG